ncbi:IQ domain-containing protein E-like [Glandiceps talaboti]
MPETLALESLSSESEEEIDLSTKPKKKSKRKTGSPYNTTKGRKVVDTRSKTARDFWIDGMKNRTGYLTTQSTPTMQGTKRAKSAGTMRPQGFDGTRTTADYNGTPRSGRAGTPSYKPAEDMYDDIIDLKRQLNGIKEENSILSTRNRRLEEENVKKQKQVEQLLDPSKSEDLRRAMNEKKPDAGAVVNSLKQKNLKLEQTLRDKEYQLTKLQSDLKSTKLEEMRVENDMYYQEILRLRNVSVSSNGVKHEHRRSDQQGGANQTAKVKALNATILRLTESNQRLQSETKFLKQDLESAMDGSIGSPTSSRKKRQRKKGKFDYEDMNRKELLAVVADLEMEIARYESGSILEGKSTGSHQVEGKLVLTGGLADRVERLDKRESELLVDKKKQDEQIIRLKEDRIKFRQMVDDNEEEIRRLKKYIQDLEIQLSERSDRPTPRRRPGSAGSSSSSRRRDEEDERYRRAEELRQKHAAKTIQGNWKKHKKRKQDDEDLDDAALLIQSNVRGHFARKEQLRKLDRSGHRSSVSSRGTPRSSRAHSPLTISDESGMDEAATTIQSAVRGHWSRKDQLSKVQPRYPPPDESDSDSYIMSRSSRSSTGKFQKTSSSGYGRSKIVSQYSDEDSDDDLITSTPTKSKGASSQSRLRPSSGWSYGSKSGRESPLRGEFGTSSKVSQLALDESDDDSDDDLIIVPSSRSRSKVF